MANMHKNVAIPAICLFICVLFNDTVNYLKLYSI